MSAAISHPGVAKREPPIPFRVIVLRDAAGLAHLPSPEGPVTRCGGLVLLHLQPGTLDPRDRLCPECCTERTERR